MHKNNDTIIAYLHEAVENVTKAMHYTDDDLMLQDLLNLRVRLNGYIYEMNLDKKEATS